jgi:cytochrome c oxidase assembly protein Cox11
MIILAVLFALFMLVIGMYYIDVLIYKMWFNRGFIKATKATKEAIEAANRLEKVLYRMECVEHED